MVDTPEIEESDEFLDGDDEIPDSEVEWIVHDKVVERKFEDQMVSRAEWEALPPTEPATKRDGPVKFVMTTFTGTNVCWNDMSCIMGTQRLQRLSMDQGGKTDLPYNFLIGGSGLVFECRGWSHTPELPEKYKHLESNAFLIGYIGIYGGVDGITDEMLSSRRELIKLGMEESHIAKRILYYQCIK
ncbi:peptidoglycan-recognition protein LF-like [Macrosteles quadrilineatus]|uniref:peptidoglycan-recognition protein LF-like n=1 Tax=Macrosteles quadrilineatus TaxID=74068 RepID=UPI0023E1A197|nr:peptidoglycan-recognition protein LF-like [Macrosteles quadrilineatus]